MAHHELYTHKLRTLQSINYGMASGRWLPPTHFGRSLGLRVHQIQILSRIPAPKPPHEPRRVQVNLLHGMDPPHLGARRRALLPSPIPLLCRTKESLCTNGCQTLRYCRLDRLPRIHRLVDGQIRAERRPLCAWKPSSSVAVQIDDAFGHGVLMLHRHVLEWPLHPT